MAIQAMWVHGNTARTQETTDKLDDIPTREHSALLGYPQGHGITFLGRGGVNGENWFHFCIPTPCWREDEKGSRRARLKKIFVLYEAQDGVSLSAVHVWDGSTRKFTRDALAIGGRHLSVDNMNAWVLPDKPEIYYGVGISVLIDFDRRGEITFASVGADFEV